MLAKARGTIDQVAEGCIRRFLPTADTSRVLTSRTLNKISACLVETFYLRQRLIVLVTNAPVLQRLTKRN